MVIGREEVVA